jgi:hypothetical protein
LKPLATAYFEVFPAAFSREANQPISYQIDRFRIKDERFAGIAKWEANATAAGEWTTNFHQRYQRS